MNITKFRLMGDLENKLIVERKMDPLHARFEVLMVFDISISDEVKKSHL